nr:hypothetical protein Iba_chr10cCG12190 [Ipomoea batatas]
MGVGLGHIHPNVEFPDPTMDAHFNSQAIVVGYRLPSVFALCHPPAAFPLLPAIDDRRTEAAPPKPPSSPSAIRLPTSLCFPQSTTDGPKQHCRETEAAPPPPPPSPTGCARSR